MGMVEVKKERERKKISFSLFFFLFRSSRLLWGSIRLAQHSAAEAASIFVRLLLIGIFHFRQVGIRQSAHPLQRTDFIFYTLCTVAALDTPRRFFLPSLRTKCSIMVSWIHFNLPEPCLRPQSPIIRRKVLEASEEIVILCKNKNWSDYKWKAWLVRPWAGGVGAFRLMCERESEISFVKKICLSCFLFPF